MTDTCECPRCWSAGRNGTSLAGSPPYCHRCNPPHWLNQRPTLPGGVLFPFLCHDPCLCLCGSFRRWKELQRMPTSGFWSLNGPCWPSLFRVSGGNSCGWVAMRISPCLMMLPSSKNFLRFAPYIPRVWCSACMRYHWLHSR